MKNESAAGKLASMTAYGFGETSQGDLIFSCEIRSLNSRFLEVNVRLPRPLIALEVEIINHVKSQLKRGKIDLFLDLTKSNGVRDLPQLDTNAVVHYADVVAQLRTTLAGKGIQSQHELSSLYDVLRLEGVLTQETKSRLRGTDHADLHREPVFQAVSQALNQLKAARLKEGEALAGALRDLCQTLRSHADQVESKRGRIHESLQKTYLKRLDHLLTNLQNVASEVTKDPIKIDDSRLLAEITFLLDKSDIEEEVTRLATHIDEFERLLRAEEAPGRKLDFLCQEMHREVNTISNKLVQTDVSQHTIEMKQAIERIRQQVQNLE